MTSLFALTIGMGFFVMDETTLHLGQVSFFTNAIAIYFTSGTPLYCGFKFSDGDHFTERDIADWRRPIISFPLESILLQLL